MAGQVVGFNRTIDWSVQPHTWFAEWVSANHADDFAAIMTFPFDLPPDELTPKWADDHFSGSTSEPADD